MSDEIYYDENRNIIEKPLDQTAPADDQVVDTFGTPLVS